MGQSYDSNAYGSTSGILKQHLSKLDHDNLRQATPCPIKRYLTSPKQLKIPPMDKNISGTWSSDWKTTIAEPRGNRPKMRLFTSSIMLLEQLHLSPNVMLETPHAGGDD